MLENGFKIENIEGLDQINRFKLHKSQLDEFEEMHVEAIIRQEKEDKISGNYRYDSMDKRIIQKYRLGDEAKKENRRVSTEIDIHKSSVNVDIGQFDKKEERIFDYTGYTLRIRKTDCNSKEIFKYIFNAFREFYGKDPNRIFSLDITRYNGFIQLNVEFVCWYALEGFNGVDEKMNEVKSEIEDILSVFEIYNYHVTLRLLE